MDAKADCRAELAQQKDHTREEQGDSSADTRRSDPPVMPQDRDVKPSVEVREITAPARSPLTITKMPAAKRAEGSFLSRLQRLPVSLIGLLGLGADELTVAAAVAPSNQKLLSLGVLWPAEVDRICAEQTQTQFLIEDFLPAKSIAIAAGESTIGKSAFICQLALCVASGTPFLGMPTEKGPVLYFDLENSILDCKTMRDSLVRFLGLLQAPDNFLLMQDPNAGLPHLLEIIRPKLVVFDSLRSYRPDVTEKNRPAAEWLQEIRKLSRKHDCAFLIVHHLRKPSKDAPPDDLESCNAATWLQEMEGPRAFVNQTDVRIAIAQGDSEPAALEVKWSRRVHGDSPVLLLERLFDEDGEAAGYKQVTGAGLLSPEKKAAFDRLPDDFCTADAKEARRACGLGNGNDPTNKFLAECKQLRIIEKRGKGRWRKRAS